MDCFALKTLKRRQSFHIIIIIDNRTPRLVDTSIQLNINNEKTVHMHTYKQINQFVYDVKKMARFLRDYGQEFALMSHGLFYDGKLQQLIRWQ